MRQQHQIYHRLYENYSKRLSADEAFGLSPFSVSREWDPSHKYQEEGMLRNKNGTPETFDYKKQVISNRPVYHGEFLERAPALPPSEQLKLRIDLNGQSNTKKSQQRSNATPGSTNLNHGNNSQSDLRPRPLGPRCQPKENTQGLRKLRPSIESPREFVRGPYPMGPRPQPEEKPKEKVRGFRGMRSSIVATSRKHEGTDGAETRVSKLRNIFDPPQNGKTPPRVLVKKRREPEARNYNVAPERIPLLEQRASISGFDGTESSPLKERIGLYESLNTRNGNPSSASTPAKNHSQEIPSARVQKGKSSGTRSQYVKDTLRRVSPSWRKTTHKNAHGSSGKQNDETGDAWWMARNNEVTNKTPRSQLSSATTKIQPSTPSKPNRPMAFEVENHAKVYQDLAKNLQRLPAREASKNRGFNVDGEGGVKPSNPVAAPLSSMSASKFNTKQPGVNRRPAIENIGIRHSSEATRVKADHTGLYTKTRRRISRSGGPFVAGVNYQLDHPKPVRSSELKRLASLCRDKIRKVSGGAKE